LTWVRPTGEAGLVPDKARLVLLSFLMLFVELALIRWAGSNIVYLSYFSNFVLLGAFLGIGIGFLRAKKARDLSGWAPVVLALFILLAQTFPITISQDSADLFTFSTLTPKGPPRELVLALVFAFSATILALITEGLARTFARFENLDAYRLDLIGSLAGIVAFAALSFLRTPPLVWGVVAALGFLALWLPKLPSVPQAIALLVLVVVLAIESFAPNTQWSPYYKITAEPNEALDGNLQVDVNGVPHQAHQSAEFAPGKNLYSAVTPERLEDVLVIGAGGGNDVAVALEKGAEHVDAVEIDPVLAQLGRDHHPDDPYDDPRVDVHIGDGRAFLERTDKEYDLIVLALPDSITLVSGQAALRLESYLFTEEAMQAAKDRLKPGGIFAMYNYYQQPWLLDRYGNTLNRVYGAPPCLQTMVPGIGEDGVDLDAFIAGGTPATVVCGPEANAVVWAPSAKPPAPATDDHPFPYLKNRSSIPTLYVVSLSIILLVSLVAVRVTAGPLRQMAPYADLFCMGVAFLLLETKHVVQFALLFGTTWFVNALVFGGVLVSVLLAIYVSKRYTFRHPTRLYLVLAASLMIAYLLPASALLELPFLPRFAAAVVVAFTPIFTANLVFTQRFKDTGDSTAAFGANLLGAMVGGVLEYAALITGYRLLLVAVAFFYGLAFLLGRRHLQAGAA
jgi:SAM-dependent methyltransferase